MTAHRYIAALHDAKIIELNQMFRRTDSEIAQELGFDKHTITRHRHRLGLPTYTKVKPAAYVPPPPIPAMKERPNPIAVAQRVLHDRLEERASGYFLDRIPVNLDSIMVETNRVLVARGLSQIGIEKWRVKCPPK